MRQKLLTQGPLVRRRILLALVFGVPVLFLRIVHDPINVPKLSLLIAGVSIVAAIRVAEIAQGAAWEGLKRLLLPAAAMGVPLLLAWAASPYRGWSLLGNYARFGGLLPYLFAILLGVLLADAFAGRASDIAWALAAAGAVAGLYALIQFAGLDPFEWSIKGGRSDQTSSTLGNPNFTGGFLALALPVAVGLALVDRERLKPAATAVVLIGGGLAVSVSQGAWLAALAGALVLAGSIGAARRPAVRILAFVAAGAIALAVFGSVAVSTFLEDPPVSDTAISRGRWWEAATAMGLDHPLLGRGPNAFAVEHARYRTAEDAAAVTTDITNDPHSVPLSFWTSAGLLGLAGFLFSVGWVIRRGASESSDNALAAGFFGAVVAYFVQSLISIDTVALRATFWVVAAGLVATLVEVKREAPRTNKKPKKRGASASAPLTRLPVVGVSIILALFGLWGAWRVLSADRAFFQGQRALADGNFSEATQHLDEALARRDDYFYRQAYGRSLGRVAVALSVRGEQGTAQELLGKTHELFAYVDGFPHVGSIVDYARTLRAWSEAGAPDAGEVATRSVDLYARAVLTDPKNAVVVNEATEFARSLQDWATLAQILQPAAPLFGDASLWGTLALAHAHQGDERRAQAALDRAFALDPQQGSALEAQVLLEADTAPSN